MYRRELLAATLFLASCANISSLNQKGSLILKPQISPYHSQTTILPYSQSSINHLILKLYTYDETEHDQNIQRTLLNAQLDNPIVFSNLKPNTNYRIRAYAYATSNETVLISDSTTSYTEVTLVQDDRPTVNNIPVHLIDRSFEGQATSSVAINAGGYSPIGSETFEITRVLTTLAGNGTAGKLDGAGAGARFNEPIHVAIDNAGYLYVADRTNQSIRKVTQGGGVTTLAGGMGTSGTADGSGGNARFTLPYGVAVDGSGYVYVGDNNGETVRKITPAGVVSTLAGMPGASGSVDGTGTGARFYYLLGLDVDAAGNVYVADEYNHAIRKVTTGGVVTTIVGSLGSSGYLDGNGTAALLRGPTDVKLDASGNLYIVDRGNNAIRKMTSAGVVTTIAGNGTSGFVDGIGLNARFYGPFSLDRDNFGNLYIADAWNHAIRKVTPNGVVTTILGGTQGFVDGTGTATRFNMPYGIAIDSAGTLYIGDRYNHSIRLAR